MKGPGISWVRVLGSAAIVAARLPVRLARPRGSPVAAFGLSAVIVVALSLQWRWSRASARRVIRQHPFPAFLRQKLRDAHPQLDDAAARQVERGRRQFFGANAQADGQFVAMPSKVVDTLWHEFILHTRGHEAFCRRACNGPGAAPAATKASTRESPTGCRCRRRCRRAVESCGEELR